jgi:dTDP-4-amino-4,6-dideoxygalactose transaminase
MIPAFTFVAAAAAVEQCGYEPYLLDIDPVSWMINPEELLQHPEHGR